MVDNGTVFEPGASRTHVAFRDLGLYQTVRNRVIVEGVLPTWPQLQRIRVVSGAMSEMKNKPNHVVLENSVRVRLWAQFTLFNMISFFVNRHKTPKNVVFAEVLGIDLENASVFISHNG